MARSRPWRSQAASSLRDGRRRRLREADREREAVLGLEHRRTLLHSFEALVSEVDLLESISFVSGTSGPIM